MRILGNGYHLCVTYIEDIRSVGSCKTSKWLFNKTRVTTELNTPISTFMWLCPRVLEFLQQKRFYMGEPLFKNIAIRPYITVLCEIFFHFQAIQKSKSFIDKF